MKALPRLNIQSLVKHCDHDANKVNNQDLDLTQLLAVIAE